MPASDPTPEERAALEHAQRVFRAERAGVLAFSEHAVPLKFVTDPQTGHIVAPVMVALLEELEAVLFVPEESDEAVQLLLTPEPLDGENHPMADRWRIHHGEPVDIRWARFHIEGARHGAMVFDGDAFMVANPLADAEPALCRRLNADKDALGALCQRVLGAAIEEPVCVGVDQDGLHVRARFGVVRVPFEHAAQSADAAERMIESMLAA